MLVELLFQFIISKLFHHHLLLTDLFIFKMVAPNAPQVPQSQPMNIPDHLMVPPVDLIFQLLALGTLLNDLDMLPHMFDQRDQVDLIVHTVDPCRSKLIDDL